MSTNSCPKKLASSIPTTCVRQSSRVLISEAPPMASDFIRMSVCDTISLSEYRLSITGLNTCTRLRAIMARRNRRISSSLLPENMGPQIASIHPRLPETKSIKTVLRLFGCSVQRFGSLAASYHGLVFAQRRIIVPEKLDHAGAEEALENLQD